MKILYAIQGTGNGHLSRAKEIIPILKEKGIVDILISGNGSNIDLEHEIKYKFHGLSYSYGKKGKIDYWKTIKNFKIIRFIKEVKSLPIKNYNIIINDFEPVSAWASKFRNSNVISLSHQNAVLDNSSPKKGKYKLEKLILKYFAPTKTRFGFHFAPYSSNIFTPIIKQKIRNSTVTNKGHYTVYLPTYHQNEIVAILSEIPIIKWHIFSKDTEELIFEKNIIIYPINEFDFIKSMVSSSGILCSAGFETPAEALFLKKKLLVIPMKNQYEQQCNAKALKEMGVTVLKKLNKKNIKNLAEWIHSDKIINVNYDDSTKDILDAILLPYYNETLISTILY